MSNTRRPRALVLIPAVGLAAPALAGIPPTGAWDLTGDSLQYVQEDQPGQYSWADYTTVFPGVNFELIGQNGIKFFGSSANDQIVGFTGDTFIPTPAGSSELRGARLIISGGADFDGSQWDDPEDLIRTEFDYTFFLTGGLLEVFRVGTSYTLFDAQDNGITGVGSSGGGEGLYEPGDHPQTFAYEDRFGGDVTAAVRMEWAIEFWFDWAPASPTDELSLRIPQNSVDITVIPAPGAATVALFAALAPRRRRR